MGRNLGACERGVLEVLKPRAALLGTAGVVAMPFLSCLLGNRRRSSVGSWRRLSDIYSGIVAISHV